MHPAHFGGFTVDDCHEASSQEVQVTKVVMPSQEISLNIISNQGNVFILEDISCKL
jgi:hypothetical protein